MKDLPSSERDCRVWWLTGLELAEEAGDAVAGGAELSGEAGFRLAGLAVNADLVRFPLPYASARDAAAAFRHLARAFVTAAEPPLRQALGVALAAAARCCRRMIEIEAEQQAAAHRRRYGED